MFILYIILGGSEKNSFFSSDLHMNLGRYQAILFNITSMARNNSYVFQKKLSKAKNKKTHNLTKKQRGSPNMSNHHEL